MHVKCFFKILQEQFLLEQSQSRLKLLQFMACTASVPVRILEVLNIFSQGVARGFYVGTLFMVKCWFRDF